MSFSESFKSDLQIEPLEHLLLLQHLVLQS